MGTEYTAKEEVGSGEEGFVFYIGDGLVAKVYTDEDRSHLAKKEFEICKELYDSGISCPKPQGIFPIDVRGFWGFGNRRLGFVMEYLPYDKLLRSPNLKAEQMMWEEIHKAEALDFIAYDCGLINTLWDEENERVYLIDFSQWVKKEEPLEGVN